MKQTIPAGTAQIIVLIGANEQYALYPIKHSLLASSDGIIVKIASKAKNTVNANNIQYPLFLIFILLMI